MIKLLILKNDAKCLLTKIREVGAEIGEPDCELEDPVEFKVEEGLSWKERMQRWPGVNLTHENKCMISSDAILTIVEPQQELLAAYKEVISD